MPSSRNGTLHSFPCYRQRWLRDHGHGTSEPLVCGVQAGGMAAGAGSGPIACARGEGGTNNSSDPRWGASGNMHDRALTDECGVARPSGVRHGVLVFLTLMSVLLYLDRICISVAVPAIRETFCLDKTQMGYVLGAFFLAYSMLQVPAGWLGDQFGTRWMLSAAVLAWSLLTAGTALAVGLYSLLVIRFLFGITEAAAYPVAARIGGRWFPLSDRAFANGVITMGGRLGGVLAPALTALLIHWFDDWRPAFILFGLLGLVWTVLFWDWFRDTPAQHPRCNAAEINLIEAGRPTARDAPAWQIPWWPMLQSLSLWMQCLWQLLGNMSWVFLITWLPTYLREQYHIDPTAAGYWACVPLLGGMVGCLLGGWLTDRLTRRLGLRWGRSLVPTVTKFLAAGAIAVCPYTQAPGETIAWLTLAAFLVDLGLGATWAYFQDTGGSYVSTFLAWANMFGNLGSAISPPLLGFLAQRFDWNASLLACAVLIALAGVCWIWIDATKPIMPPTSKD
ncbi:MAG: MFS transporter [Gemmataceae bacterium]|nr:MFS transporter [Gemmataceae bacterium]MDW8265759.1 MFS transporter [Gemmataceae bacterium]